MGRVLSLLEGLELAALAVEQDFVDIPGVVFLFEVRLVGGRLDGLVGTEGTLVLALPCVTHPVTPERVVVASLVVAVAALVPAKKGS